MRLIPHLAALALAAHLPMAAMAQTATSQQQQQQDDDDDPPPAGLNAAEPVSGLGEGFGEVGFGAALAGLLLIIFSGGGGTTTTTTTTTTSPE